jgi:Zn-dependent protease
MGDLINWPPSWSTILLVPALFVAFTVHELAHALVAFLLGDTSQVERKRLSFNPLRHVSWVGMIVFLLFRFGWAKPVWVDPTRFRIKNRAFGMFLVSIAGSAANLLTGLAALVGITITVMVVWVLTGSSPVSVMEFLVSTEPGLDAQGVAIALSYYMMTVNLLLAFFNLIPLPPLDGFQATMSLFTAIRTALSREPVTEPSPPLVAPAAALRQTVQQTAAIGEGAAGDLDAADFGDRSPAQIHFEIGLEYQRAGELDEAIARYRQAIAHDDQFALAYYNLGLAYWAKGRISLAISAFRAALKSTGDRPVRLQAEYRLRELVASEEDLPSLDPAVERRVWLSLLSGGVGLILLAVSAWFYVTMVALMATV